MSRKRRESFPAQGSSPLHAFSPPPDEPRSAERGGQRQRRGLIIGQAPNAAACDGDAALQGTSEQRLARLAGLSVAELWQRFDRRNLLDHFPGKLPKRQCHRREAGYTLHQGTGDVFPLDRAREKATQMAVDLTDYRLVVLLGLRVAAAFRLPRPRLLTLDEASLPCAALVIPHTSGVSHFWNDEAKVRAAEAALRDAILRFMGTRSRFFAEAIDSVANESASPNGRAGADGCGGAGDEASIGPLDGDARKRKWKTV